MQALKLYTSVFGKDAKLFDVERFKAGEGATEGALKTAKFTIHNQTVMVHDSPVKHEFDFTPSFSFYITCDSEEEIKNLAKALGKDGKEMMPLVSFPATSCEDPINGGCFRRTMGSVRCSAGSATDLAYRGSSI